VIHESALGGFSSLFLELRASRSARCRRESTAAIFDEFEAELFADESRSLGCDESDRLARWISPIWWRFCAWRSRILTR
jgi:hypothetical protein